MQSPDIDHTARLPDDEVQELRSVFLCLYDRLRRYDPSFRLRDWSEEPLVCFDFLTDRPRRVRALLQTFQLETSVTGELQCHSLSLPEARKRLERQNVPEKFWPRETETDGVVSLWSLAGTVFYFSKGETLSSTLVPKIDGPHPRYDRGELIWRVVLRKKNGMQPARQTGWRDTPEGPFLQPEMAEWLESLRVRHAAILSAAGFVPVLGPARKDLDPFHGLQGQVLCLTEELPLRRWHTVPREPCDPWLPEFGLFACADEMDRAGLLLETVQLPLLAGELAELFRGFLFDLGLTVKSRIAGARRDNGDLRSCLRLMARISGWEAGEETTGEIGPPRLEFIYRDSSGREQAGPFIRVIRQSGILALDSQLQERELCRLDFSLTGGWRRLLAAVIDAGQGPADLGEISCLTLLASSSGLLERMHAIAELVRECGLQVRGPYCRQDDTLPRGAIRHSAGRPLLVLTGAGLVLLRDTALRLPDDEGVLKRVLRDLR